MNKIEQLKTLVSELREDGLLNITLTSNGQLRLLYSAAEHPDIEYERGYHSEGYDQMVANYEGVRILYLVDDYESL